LLSAFIAFADVPDAPPGRMPGNVLTQTVTFLEPVRTDGGLVLDVEPTYAGQGRAHGGGRISDDSGRLLATFSTTGVLRAPRTA
jgi:acyl-CoA thioesterase-2